jgi:hypothetical protein
MRIQIPPNRKMVETMVSRLIGKRYTFRFRFHSSLALLFSAGDNEEPNKPAVAISAMNPVRANTTPTSWIKKMSAMNGFYQC